jgi:hypothetical protein
MVDLEPQIHEVQLRDVIEDDIQVFFIHQLDAS